MSSGNLRRDRGLEIRARTGPARRERPAYEMPWPLRPAARSLSR